MRSKTHFILAFLFYVLGLSELAHAQITYKPISESTHTDRSNMRTAAAERDSTQIELPFWIIFRDQTICQIPHIGLWMLVLQIFQVV